MTFLRTLKKLLLGETWLLPLGVAAMVAISLLARSVLGAAWHNAGGFVLLAGVTVVLVASVSVGARPPRADRATTGPTSEGEG